jgi:hypothetical protein
MRTARVMFMALVIMCGMTACSHRDYTVTSADEALCQRLSQIVIVQGWLDYSLVQGLMGTDDRSIRDWAWSSRFHPGSPVGGPG